VRNGEVFIKHQAALMIFIISSLCFARMSRDTPSTPISTTVCDIAQNPKRFDHKTVLLRARFDKPWLENATLSDQTCDSVGIAANLSDKTRGNSALQDVLNTGRPGTSDKTITATWIGVFRWHPGKVPSRVLNVIEIKDIKLEPVGGPHLGSMKQGAPSLDFQTHDYTYDKVLHL
jgi:hypothetical protein